MKVLVTSPSFSLTDLPADWKVIRNPFGRALSEEETVNLVARHQPDGLIAGIEPLTRRVMAQSPNLKGISRFGAGHDTVDLKAARDLGIPVTVTAVSPVPAVAEYTLGATLSLLRRFPELDGIVRDRTWKAAPGELLQGRTVGIVGCGRIGTRVGALFSAFGCRVVGSDPGLLAHPTIPLWSLDEVLAEADILTLHIPLTGNTFHLLNRRLIGRMKPGAYLVNAGWGGLVDEDALAEALRQGHLAGAAIDCFEREPYTGPLVDTPRTLLSPHVAYSARETRMAMEREAVHNLLRAFGASEDEPLAPPTVESRIQLRPFAPGDLLHMARRAAQKDERAFRQWAGDLLPYPLTLEAVLKYYEKGMNSRESDRMAFRIVRDADGEGTAEEPLGMVQLFRFDSVENSASIGLFVLWDEEDRGAGCGSQALRELLNIGFTELGLSRIYLNVHAWNQRALRCYQANGFVEVGRIPDRANPGDDAWTLIRMKIERT